MVGWLSCHAFPDNDDNQNDTVWELLCGSLSSLWERRRKAKGIKDDGDNKRWLRNRKKKKKTPRRRLNNIRERAPFVCVLLVVVGYLHLSAPTFSPRSVHNKRHLDSYIFLRVSLGNSSTHNLFKKRRKRKKINKWFYIYILCAAHRHKKMVGGKMKT